MNDTETWEWHKIFDSLDQAEQKISLDHIHPIRLGLQKICLVRTAQEWFAIEDACPHKLIPLSKGELNAQNQIVCVWHQYCFDLSSGEEQTGKNIRPLKYFPLEVRSDGLYLGLPPKTPRDEFSF